MAQHQHHGELMAILSLLDAAAIAKHKVAPSRRDGALETANFGKAPHPNEVAALKQHVDSPYGGAQYGDSHYGEGYQRGFDFQQQAPLQTVPPPPPPKAQVSHEPQMQDYYQSYDNRQSHYPAMNLTHGQGPPVPPLPPESPERVGIVFAADDEEPQKKKKKKRKTEAPAAASGSATSDEVQAIYLCLQYINPHGEALGRCVQRLAEQRDPGAEQAHRAAGVLARLGYDLAKVTMPHLTKQLQALQSA